MHDLAYWDRTTFDADGLTGERLNYRKSGVTTATVVIWPGRTTRIYWRGGAIQDVHYRAPGEVFGQSSRGRAVEIVEQAARS